MTNQLRHILRVAVFVVAVVVVFVGGVVHWRMVGVRQTQLEQQRQSITAIEKQLLQSDAVDEIALLHSQIEGMMNHDVSRVVQQVMSHLDDVNVIDRSVTTAATIEGSSLRMFPTHVSFHGSLPQVFGLLDYLYKNEKVIRVEELEISRSAITDEDLSVSLQLVGLACRQEKATR